MKKTTLALGLLAALTGSAMAQEGAVPKGIPHLDHVFVIMMENHGHKEILNNPSAPFTNKYAKSANLATNYFAVAHPSLTNYLEVVGGSNFGIHSDNFPDWHDGSCATNLSTGTVNTDSPPSPAICPVSGTGTDAETPILDCSNEGHRTSMRDQYRRQNVVSGSFYHARNHHCRPVGRRGKDLEDLPGKSPDHWSESGGLQ